MLDLSGRGDEYIKQICSTGLNQVPPDTVELNDDMVKALVSLLSAAEGSVILETRDAIPEPPEHDLRPWTLRSSHIAENTINLQPTWINEVCQDFEVSWLRRTGSNFKYLIIKL